MANSVAIFVAGSAVGRVSAILRDVTLLAAVVAGLLQGRRLGAIARAVTRLVAVEARRVGIHDVVRAGLGHVAGLSATEARGILRGFLALAAQVTNSSTAVADHFA